MDPLSRREVMKAAAIVGGGSLMLAANRVGAGEHDDDEDALPAGHPQHKRDRRNDRDADGLLAMALPADMSQAVKALKGEGKKVEKPALPGGMRAGTICHDKTWPEVLNIYSGGTVVGVIESMYLLWCNDGYWDLTYRGYLYTWCLRDWRWRFTFYNRYGYAVAYINTPPKVFYSGPIDVHQTGTERTVALHFLEIESVGRAGRGYLC